MVLHGDGFDHIAYFKQGQATNHHALHVYLEGDGTPWLRRGTPAPDPTPRKPLMFDLMTRDPAPSLYLGRPCYHGLRDSACTPEKWTNKRYSEEIVASMSAALDGATTGYRSMVLLGYSGGGTLAMLLAERQPRVVALVTVAANLDTAAWTQLHGQQPLDGSLNPALRPPLRADIRQLHYTGAEDDNVPPQLVRAAISQQAGAIFREYPKQDHSCCWSKVWPQVLAELTTK